MRELPCHVVFQYRTDQTLRPGEPWHNQDLVPLPPKNELGIANGTNYQQALFTPVQQSSGTYALKGGATPTDPSKVPYLVALDSQAGTRTVAMQVLFIPDPSTSNFDAQANVCPDGYACYANLWSMKTPNKDGVYNDFGFSQNTGIWQPYADSPGGLTVYWKGAAGQYTPIKIDLVPAGTNPELEGPGEIPNLFPDGDLSGDPYQQPGGDDQQPGGDDQQPGGDDQQPGDDDQQPGGDEQQPTPTGWDDQQPTPTGWDDQQPWGSKPGSDFDDYGYPQGWQDGALVPPCEECMEMGWAGNPKKKARKMRV